ncbi:YdjY domain-containing protein [Paucibacter soli]|uniref:YdjY domain-containing protein n=1 Tax=Paucibacter soli TaxID=3133433 RepID=UPI0030A51296
MMMRRRRGLLTLAACLTLGWSATLSGAQTPASRVGELRPLGQDRFQIGRIVVDKRAGRFSVPGRVHVLGKPLEYLATSPGGLKAYETMLELDASGSEFNLACILLGLERDANEVPWRQYRQVPRLVGARVALFIAWSEGGKRRQVSAAQALLNADAGVQPDSVEWVYTGSPVSEGNARFAADDTGTLIGFVHDASSIIEAAAPIGIGAYGSVRGHAMVPPVGTAIELVVELASGAK